MKAGDRRQEIGDRSQDAFTLIELLVVISIIALLAGLTLTVTAGISRTKMRSLARAELAQIEADIQIYKAKTGTYPPADTNNPALNPLYYELGGTKLDDKTGVYTTLDGSAQIKATDVPQVFGAGMGGFINSTKGGGGDEVPAPQKFLRGIKAGQFLAVTNLSGITVTLLGAPLDGPILYLSPSGTRLNPWRYNSATPTNNPKTYDLWIDFLVGGKTNRVSNWSQRAEVL